MVQALGLPPVGTSSAGRPTAAPGQQPPAAAQQQQAYTVEEPDDDEPANGSTPTAAAVPCDCEEPSDCTALVLAAPPPRGPCNSHSAQATAAAPAGNRSSRCRVMVHTETVVTHSAVAGHQPGSHSGAAAAAVAGRGDAASVLQHRRVVVQQVITQHHGAEEGGAASLRPRTGGDVRGLLLCQWRHRRRACLWPRKCLRP
jgi:hypothetical protein